MLENIEGSAIMIMQSMGAVSLFYAMLQMLRKNDPRGGFLRGSFVKSGSCSLQVSVFQLKFARRMTCMVVLYGVRDCG
uniref:Uncharacterized protein n=1 Tax=Ditylenchus dipsaci TaxID=166011 RepID=A0A915CY13_9BILA